MEPASSTSSKFAANNVETPILTLPADVLAKIIAFVPTAQWPSLDLLKDFHDASRIAWEQLRNINLDRGLLIKPDRSSLAEALEYLVDRSPFLTSMSGIDLRVNPDSDVIRVLAKFEHLQSITMGDARLFNLGRYDRPRGVRLDALVEFLESTRSRTNLKRLKLFNVNHGDVCHCVHFHIYSESILDRFHSSLANVRELDSHEWTQIRRPFKLEKFSFSTTSWLYIRLDTLDATCLTDLRLGPTNVGVHVEPVQLTNLIDRAPNLRRIELLLRCKRAPPENDCRRPHLEENRQLLAALARHENLTTIKFDFLEDRCECLKIAPEFIQMLKGIGRRGQLRKLVLLPDMYITKIDWNEIFSTIYECIPYLRSITLCIREIHREIVSNIASMSELEELHFTGDNVLLDGNAITKISQLPNLKRLAIPGTVDGISLESLAKATTLTDLRIGDEYSQKNINPDVFEKWSEGFGSNLQILMLYGCREVAGIDAKNSTKQRRRHRRGKRQDEKEEDNRAEGGLIRLLEGAVRLRILILDGNISDRSMMAIAKSCPELEVLGVRSTSNEITARGVQEIVDRCPKLRRLGGISDERNQRGSRAGYDESEIRSQLQIPKYRKIGDVDMKFREYDFDDRCFD